MKEANCCSVNLRKLVTMLQNALDKERDTWQLNSFAMLNDADIGLQGRDEIVRWLFTLSSCLKLNPETAVLSANILDSFLCVVKAQPKYLVCISLSCLLLAAKILEEDEMIPPADYLVKCTKCCCSVADILRMEMIILNKLKWNLSKVTALDFVYILHAIVVCQQPNLLARFRHMTAAKQLAMLVQKLLVCQQSSEVVTFPPSTQALALISLELGLCTDGWLALTVMLQKLTRVDNKELIQCREVMAAALITREASSFYLRRTVRHKRKVEQLEEEDDIYDSIKRLYGEDMSYDGNVIVSCSHEAAREDASVHVVVPVLQAS